MTDTSNRSNRSNQPDSADPRSVAYAHRPTWLEVDKSALLNNYRVAATLAEPLLAVVKADAYGHGLVPVSRLLQTAGAAMLGVATVAEGEALRAAGITLPVLLLGGYLADQAAAIVAAELTPTLFEAAQLPAIAAAVQAAGKDDYAVHLKVDTGMGRIGVPVAEAAAWVDRIAATDGLRLEGILTHFAEADLDDPAAAVAQLAPLVALQTALGERGISVRYWHAANSAAVMHRLAAVGECRPYGNLARPGIMLYGLSPAPALATVPLTPVATWKARAIQVKTVPAGTRISYGGTFVTDRPTTVVTLPVGYADGYPRLLSNRGSVLMQGRRLPVIGRVCMDMTLVDATSLPTRPRVGDEVVLLGRQVYEGQADEVTAAELAGLCDTIHYDIVCGISPRVPRLYVGGDRGHG